MEQEHKMNHKKVIAIQMIFLAIVLGGVYFAYPKVNFELEGNAVNFKTINAKVIMISENPDFSNSRYINIGKDENVSFELAPGKYYWRGSNGIIQGMENSFEIPSEVGLEINKTEDGDELVNVGNVKVNVTKTKEGTMVGYIIIEPDESEKIENKPGEEYQGEQNE